MARLAAVFSCFLILTASWAETGRGTLAEGTRWQTEYVIHHSGRPGPTVVVVGGIHGNEPAGYRAAEEIASWQISSGTLIVIPRANARGIEAGTRYLTRTPDRDLNRNFPTAATPTTKSAVARDIWRLVERTRPDWLVDMHEAKGLRGLKPTSIGNTIIHHPSNTTRLEIDPLIHAVNATIADSTDHFQLLRYAKVHSLARGAADRLGTDALIVETGLPQPLARRVRQHRVVVHALLSQLGMLPEGASPDTFFSSERAGGERRVAVYYETGISDNSTAKLLQRLEEIAGVKAHVIGPAEIAGGALSQFDAVCFPGGSGGGEARALGEAGRDAVREFVQTGGAYLGFCAGSYLASAHYSWSLGILDAKVLDTNHWKRGTGPVQIALTSEGEALLGESGAETISSHYANGPLLAPGGSDELPDYTELATFRSDMAKGVPGGAMPGTTAIAAGRYGKGRVVCFSPHPELTPGLESLIAKALDWAE